MYYLRLYFFGRQKYKSGHNVSGHTNGGAEFILHLSGSGSSVINGKAHPFKKGCVTVVAGDSYHAETHDEDSESIYFGTWISPFYESACVPEGVYYPQEPEISYIFKRIYDEAQGQKFHHVAVISAKICELLALLSRETHGESAQKKKLDYCMNFICENCHTDIDLTSLAESYGCSYDVFRHLFKKEYGISPQKAIIRQRLIYSKAMLESTNMTCTEIALACGFSDSSQFSRMFSAHYGVSPKSIREART